MQYLYKLTTILLGKPPKKRQKKFHNSCELSPLLELENRCFFAIIKSLWMREMTKSLSKISLKSSSKQTDYEKFSSLWTKIWYCSGEVLPGRIFEFSIRSEIRRCRIRKCEDWSYEGQFCEGRPPLPMPNGTNQSLTLFWMEVCINETLHLEFWMN